MSKIALIQNLFTIISDIGLSIEYAMTKTRKDYCKLKIIRKKLAQVALVMADQCLPHWSSLIASTTVRLTSLTNTQVSLRFELAPALLRTVEPCWLLQSEGYQGLWNSFGWLVWFGIWKWKGSVPSPPCWLSSLFEKQSRGWRLLMPSTHRWEQHTVSEDG